MKKIYDIIKKLEASDWEVKSVDFEVKEVIAKKKYAEVSIYIEECLCHGGRMTIKEKHSNQWFRIEHESYDESLGIIDSSTELDFIIENEMMDYINKFSTFIYKLTKINEYTSVSGVEKEEITYFANIESLTYRILENSSVKDYNLIERDEHRYPNPNIKKIVERIYKEDKYSWSRDRVWFKETRLTRKDKDSEWEIEREYEMYVSVFKKGR